MLQFLKKKKDAILKNWNKIQIQLFHNTFGVKQLEVLFDRMFLHNILKSYFISAKYKTQVV